MFREMRRKKQLLDEAITLEILEKRTSGTLALMGDDGYTYSLPISFLYKDGVFYFHGSKVGHKVDAMRKHNKVSFSVIDQDRVIPEANTTHFRSVIAFGTIELIEDDVEKRKAIEIFAYKFAPGDKYKESREKEIELDFNNFMVYKMTVEHMTGKEHLSLVNQRKL